MASKKEVKVPAGGLMANGFFWAMNYSVISIAITLFNKAVLSSYGECCTSQTRTTSGNCISTPTVLMHPIHSTASAFILPALSGCIICLNEWRYCDALHSFAQRCFRGLVHAGADPGSLKPRGGRCAVEP